MRPTKGHTLLFSLASLEIIPTEDDNLLDLGSSTCALVELQRTGGFNSRT